MNHAKISVYSFLLFIFLNCNLLAQEEFDSEKYNDSIIKSIKINLKDEWGFRFNILCDYNGDSKIDTVREIVLNSQTQFEIPKWYEKLDTNLDEMDQILALSANKHPISYLIGNNKDTFLLGQHDQLLGLAFLKNEGDLDGIAGDELSYVNEYVDYSNCNSVHIISFKKGKWIELYSFSIHETDLPELPIIKSINELYNEKGKYKYHKYIKSFKGFVKKIKKNVIKIDCLNEEAELVSKIINLKPIYGNKKQ